MRRHLPGGRKLTLEAPANAFRVVDGFLSSQIDASMIAYGLGQGWFGQLARGIGALDDLVGFAGLNLNARKFVGARLTGLGLFDPAAPGCGGPRLALFRQFQDLLEARLWFLLEIAPDLHDHFSLFLGDPGRFVQTARIFRLFDYSEALKSGPEAEVKTQRWMRYTSVLSAYEGPPLADLLPLDTESHVFDLGGNSGAFALSLVARFPVLKVDVVDLPAVCALGERFVAGRPGAERIRFRPVDLRQDNLPGGAATMLFKSVLHDWPDASVAHYLGLCHRALPDNGRLIILEREPFAPSDPVLGFSALANLAFMPFFRSAAAYGQLLNAAGFDLVSEQRVELDGWFQVLVARRR